MVKTSLLAMRIVASVMNESSRIFAKFGTHLECIKCLEAVRWNSVPRCPYCDSAKHSPMARESRYHCGGCNTSYSVTVSTLFHNTRVDLRKWFVLLAILVNSRRIPAVRQLAIEIGVNKNTACYMAMRVRRWMIKDRDFLLRLADKIAE